MLFLLLWKGSANVHWCCTLSRDLGRNTIHALPRLKYANLYILCFIMPYLVYYGLYMLYYDHLWPTMAIYASPCLYILYHIFYTLYSIPYNGFSGLLYILLMPIYVYLWLSMLYYGYLCFYILYNGVSTLLWLPMLYYIYIWYSMAMLSMLFYAI
jgi:hypothetical protein